MKPKNYDLIASETYIKFTHLKQKDEEDKIFHEAFLEALDTDQLKLHRKDGGIPYPTHITICVVEALNTTFKGYAFCSKAEPQYEKRKGRLISRGRAQKAINLYKESH